MKNIALKLKLTEQNQHTIYKQEPPLLLIARFIEHVNQTNSPETFPGIHLGPISRFTKFKILQEFELIGKKRIGSERAPCPMCQPNKYLKGSLVWLPELEAIAAIGHCCADKVNLAAARKQFHEEQTARRNEDFLLKALPHVHVVNGLVNRAKPSAEEALRVFRAMRKEGSYFLESLKGARKTGLLQLSEKIEQLSSDEFVKTSKSRTVEFGILRGSTALITEYNPIADLARVYRDCEGFDVGKSDADAVEFIVKLDSQKIANAVTMLEQARTDFQRFQKRIKDFLQFFDENNIAVLNAWSSSLLNPTPFSVKIGVRPNGKSIEFKSPHQTLRITLHSNLWVTDEEFPY